MSSSEPEQIEIPTVWVGLDDLTVHASNQMAIQHSAANEFVLSFGYLAPPLIIGDEPERRRQVEMIAFLPVKPIVRIGFNRQRLQELIEILERNLHKHDSKFA